MGLGNKDVPVGDDRRGVHADGGRPGRRVRNGRCVVAFQPRAAAASFFPCEALCLPCYSTVPRSAAADVLIARLGVAEFDGYPMHGAGGPGEKVKAIPLDFFNGARHMTVSLHRNQASQP